MDPTLEFRLKKAKIQLLVDSPFFGTLATQLENIEDPTIGTAATNGSWIRWDPKFVKELSEEELKAVLAHEVLHVANGHCWRRNSRHPIAWNIACDYSINEILRDCGFKLPACGIFPPKGEENKCAEAHYKAPTEISIKIQMGGNGKGKQGSQGQQGQGSGQNGSEDDPGGMGGVVDCAIGEEAGKEADWKILVAQAIQAQKSHKPGSLPASLARMAEEIVDPKVSWEVLLRDFVERSAKNDYNWNVPNRRYIGSGFVLPSLISDELPAIVLVKDTSGSIGQEEMNQYEAELSAIFAQFDTTIHVLYCDTRVALAEELTRADLPLRFNRNQDKSTGGGGTSFKDPMRWVAKQGIEPACMIYLTDGYGEWDDKAPEYPVLWIMTTEVKAPWGETIRIELK